MDFAFARRTALTVAPTIDALLARLAAAQAATPTAAAQQSLAQSLHDAMPADPRLPLFSGSYGRAAPTCGTASFAAAFNPCQPN